MACREARAGFLSAGAIIMMSAKIHIKNTAATFRFPELINYYRYNERRCPVHHLPIFNSIDADHGHDVIK